eukprot:m.22338 g.22338  ORF g.22338 m.22338 type:complete len:190 (+) comp8277_c0_seq2:1139-1708(+)
MDVELIHMSTRHVATLPPDGTVGDLAAAAESAFGVPAAAQKLVHKGKTLTHMDQALAAAGVGHKSKVMVLGKKNDAQATGNAAAMAEVESSIMKLRAECAELATRVDGVEKGFIPADLVDSECRTTTKLVSKTIEAAMKLLERLDSLSIPPDPPQPRAHRSGLVKDLQALLSVADGLHDRLATAKAPKQ